MEEKKSINVLVGANIKRERERYGYTQEQFSELIGFETKSLSAIERGIVGVSLPALKRICQVLSISSDRLLFGETTPPSCTLDLVQRLERLTPAQYRIASDMLNKILEAFYLSEPDSDENS